MGGVRGARSVGTGVASVGKDELVNPNRTARGEAWLTYSAFLCAFVFLAMRLHLRMRMRMNCVHDPDAEYLCGGGYTLRVTP